jgi:hypothetical protein
MSELVPVKKIRLGVPCNRKRHPHLVSRWDGMRAGTNRLLPALDLEEGCLDVELAQLLCYHEGEETAKRLALAHWSPDVAVVHARCL